MLEGEPRAVWYKWCVLELKFSQSFTSDVLRGGIRQSSSNQSNGRVALYASLDIQIFESVHSAFLALPKMHGTFPDKPIG